MTQPTRYAIEENNPCLKEHEQSLECMDKHSKRFCKEIIENYKNCKKFWGAVQKLHLDNGRSRRLPLGEEKAFYKKQFVEWKTSGKLRLIEK